MPEFDPEMIDLAALARKLADVLRESSLEGAIVGRTLLRDAVAAQLRCSQLDAERLVDTMVGRGFLRFDRDASGASPGIWRIDPQ